MVDGGDHAHLVGIEPGINTSDKISVRQVRHGVARATRVAVTTIKSLEQS